MDMRLRYGVWRSARMEKRSPPGVMMEISTYGAQVLANRKMRLIGNTGIIFSTAFSPDGRILASGNDDFTIQLWDANTGEQIATLTGHLERVWSVAFSPDGKTLASGSDDGTVLLWRLR